MSFIMDNYIIISLAVFAVLVLAALYHLYSKVSNKDELRGEQGVQGVQGYMGRGVELDSVQVKILNPMIVNDNRFSVPTRATEGSAGIDLRACIDEPIVIPAGESVMVGTGISIYIKDPNFVGVILPRSGLGSKHGIVLGNLVGLIDSDYQGELMISVWNRGWNDFTLEPATKFAQYVVLPVVTPRFNLVEEFDEGTARGANGFGHSGTV